MFLPLGTKVTRCVTSGQIGGVGVICGAVHYDETVRQEVVLVKWNPHHVKDWDITVPNSGAFVPLANLHIEETDLHGPWRGDTVNDEFRASQGRPVYLAESEMSLQEQVLEQLWKHECVRARAEKKRQLNNAMVLADNITDEANRFINQFSKHRAVQESSNGKDKILVKKMNAAIRGLTHQIHSANQARLDDIYPSQMEAAKLIQNNLRTVAAQVVRNELWWQDEEEDDLEGQDEVTDKYCYKSAADAYEGSRIGNKEREKFEQEMRFAKSWVTAY